jgi:transposase-like protein
VLKEPVQYGEAFKQNVVREVERGEISASGATLKYGIGGSMTVYKWVRKYGPPAALEVARITMANHSKEKSRRELEKQQLESALAHAHLKIMALEELIDVAEETYRIPIKKNFGRSLSGASTSGEGPASSASVDSSTTAGKDSTSGEKS